MRKIVFLLLCALVACVPVSEIEERPVAPSPEVPVVKEPVRNVLAGEPATRTVKQQGSLGTFIYGLTEDNRLVRVEKTGAVWEYKYEGGRLVEVLGPESVEFLYVQGRLDAIDLGAVKLSFGYDSKSRLVSVKGGRETLYMEYDSLDRLRTVKRGVAGETFIDYDKENRIKYLTRGPITTNVFFDDRNRVRSFDANDAKFILGYWRDDKLSSLTGTTFGRGLTASYGPDYPPFEAKIVSEQDDSVFTAAYTDTLYKVVDDYLYCRHVRRFNDLLFEGISYAFFVNYFHGGISDYIAMHFRCLPYEA